MNNFREARYSYSRAALAFFYVAMVVLVPLPSMAGVLDDVSGAYAAYSVRKLSNSYDGYALQVKRTSDRTTRDIGFDPQNNVDQELLLSFCSDTDCFVTIWYDQVGSMDITQTKPGEQPQIVVNGEIIVDPQAKQGKVRLAFTEDSMAGAGTPISTHDLTAFWMQQADFDAKSYPITLDNYNTLEFWIEGRKGAGGFIGNGVADSWVGLLGGDVQKDLAAYRPVLLTLDLAGNDVALYRGVNYLIKSNSHDRSAAVTSKFKIGQYTGFLQEVILYRHLLENERWRVFADVDDYYDSPLPSTPNNGTLLPQRWQYQVDLYDWLKTLEKSDFVAVPGDLTWSGAYGNVDELANLWLTMQGAAGEHDSANVTDIVRADSNWFVLNDRLGGGIEGTDSVRVFRPASTAAFLYTQNLPGGNPYYRKRGVAMRGLVSIAVDMVMHDRLQDSAFAYWGSVDFAGGSMLGWLWAYENFRNQVDPIVQSAFEDGFGHFVFKMRQRAAHDVNGNIDTKAIAALARTYNLLSNPEQKVWCVEAAKRILFGSTAGTVDTTDYVTGLFRKAGYIDEGDSPETTYNGASLYYLTEARAVTRGQSDWEFLEEVLERMVKFKVYQYFPDPDGHWTGPSGYAGRTGESYIADQRNKLWRNITLADEFLIAQPLVYDVVQGKSCVKTIASMVNDIHTMAGWYNTRGIGTVSTAVPTVWSEEHWPAENFYFPRSGWYGRLFELSNSPDSYLDYPYQRSSNFSQVFDEEFWAFKGGVGDAGFGFFIETLADPGLYTGWYGGSLQAFWTKDAGVLLLARHDKSGSEANKQENTRVWSQIDSWATHHIWGKAENGGYFSSAATEGVKHSVQYHVLSETAGALAADVTSQIGPPSKKGQQTGAELSGQLVLKNRFSTLDNGLQAEHTITYSGDDNLSELWLTLPVYLRDSDQSVADTSVEYWDGDSWVLLGTSLISTSKIRLGRNFGGNFKYGYIVFDQLRDLALSEAIWVQSYQGNSRHRNIKIDLHGHPGTLTRIAPEIQIKVKLLADQITIEPLVAPPTPPRKLRIRRAASFISYRN